MSRFKELQSIVSQQVKFRTPAEMSPSKQLGKTDESVSGKALGVLEDTGSVKEVQLNRSLTVPKSLNSEAVKASQTAKDFFGDQLSGLARRASKVFSSVFFLVFISEKIGGRVSSQRLSQKMGSEIRKSESQVAKNIRGWPDEVAQSTSIFEEANKPPPGRGTLDKYFAKVLEKGVGELLEEIHKLKTQPFSSSVGNPTQKLQENNAEEAQLCLDIVSGVRTIADLKESEDSSGIKTFLFTHEGLDYEINHSQDPHVYNGVKNKDLIRRAELIFDAANDPKLNVLKKKTLENLSGLCRNPDQIDDDLKNGLDILADVFYQVETRMKKENPNFDLQRAEAEHIRDRGRPIIVNIFEVEAGGERRTFVGMHKPMSEETIPSSMQSENKLANYVSTSAGVVRDGKVEMKYTGIRHSRPSPIAIEDSHQRRAISASNVKQSIVDIANKMEVNENNSEKNPLPVPLAPTTLLTAKVGDIVRNRKKKVAGSWMGDSESMQLQEAMQAYRLYDGCVLNVNGVWIKPVIHHMNFGVNPPGANHGLKGKVPDAPFQNELNAHGMMAQHQLVKDFFSENISDEGLKNRVFEFLSGDLTKLEGQYKDLKEVIHRNLQKDQEALASHYENYSRKPSRKIEKEIVKLEKRIAGEYKRLDIIARGLVKKQKEAFLGQPNRHEVLESLKEELNPALASLLQDHEDFRRAIFTMAHKNTATVVDVPAMRNMIYQKLGILSLFYCKSAEDRTGNVEIETFQRMIFEEMSGKPPGIVDCKETGITNEIFRQVFNASPSLNNTEHNSDSRGLQISPEVNPPDMEQQIKQQKKMAEFAKEVPKKAREKVQ